jgi:hypothetical protein
MGNPFDYDYGNAARTIGQGLTYGFSDELEAAIRAAAQGDPARYAQIRDRIRAQQERYAAANPNTAMALEGAGMIGSAMLTPQLAAAKGLGALTRAAPRTTKFVVGGVEDALQGALYAAGQAKDVKSIPKTIREEAPYNAAFYTGASGVGSAGKRILRAKPIKSRMERLMELLGR